MAEDVLEFEPSKEDLLHLREWISKSPHIIQDYDDKVLSAFVRGCKGSLQKTKKILENFNSLGQRYPEIMKNYDPLDQRFVEHTSEVLVFPLPKKTPDGCNVFFSKPKDHEGHNSDPYKSHATDFVRCWILSLYIYFWNNDFGPGKWILIGEYKNTTFIHSRELTPVIAKQILEMMQNALPIRIQAVHLLNVPPFFEHICNVAKSFASKKIQERIYFHSTMKTFYEKVPKEILPKDYGGHDETTLILHERWHETLKSYRQRFLEEESKMRRLDPLRPKTHDAEEMAGTFKALNVD